MWLILSIHYAIQAYDGKVRSIPIVGAFAKKYAAA